MNVRSLTISIALAAATACGGDEPQAGSGPAESSPTDGTGAFAPLTETLDRAEGVQSTIDARAEETRRRIEEAEQ